MFYNDKVVIVADPYHLSGINREAFVDQQEWALYAHVNTQQRYIREFIFRDTDGEEDENEEVENANSKEGRKRSILTVTSHAGWYFTEQNEKKKICFFSFQSSPIKLLLLEWILSYFINNIGLVLYLCNSTAVSHP
jgi:hypothetical protein